MHKQIILLLFLFSTKSLFGQSSNPAPRVSFTLSNPSLRTRIIDIRYYGDATRKQSGYGYEMGAWHSHAVNMPAGTFIYEKQGQEWKLKLVIHPEDGGRKFDLSKSYEISREESLAAAQHELDEQTAAQEKLQSEAEIERITKIAATDLVTFKVGGKSVWGKQVYVRAEIPGDEQNFNDFVNTYRVEAVKKRMADPASAHLSLLGIGLDSGFNSKATFNRAFKKFTGQSPREFMGRMKEDA